MGSQHLVVEQYQKQHNLAKEPLQENNEGKCIDLFHGHYRSYKVFSPAYFS